MFYVQKVQIENSKFKNFNTKLEIQMCSMSKNFCVNSIFNISNSKLKILNPKLSIPYFESEIVHFNAYLKISSSAKNVGNTRPKMKFLKFITQNPQYYIRKRGK